MAERDNNGVDIIMDEQEFMDMVIYDDNHNDNNQEEKANILDKADNLANSHISDLSRVVVDSQDPNYILNQHSSNNKRLALRHRNNRDVDKLSQQKDINYISRYKPRSLKADATNYRDSKVVGNIDRFYCPCTSLPLCNKRMTNKNFKGWKSSDLLRKHLQTEHCKVGNIHDVPDTYWLKRKKDYCFIHKVIFAHTVNGKKHKECPTFRNGASYRDGILEDDGDINMEQLPELQAHLIDEAALPSYEDIVKYNLPVINDIPKKLKPLWIHNLDQLLDLIINEHSDEAWKIYLMTAKILFHDTMKNFFLYRN